VQYENIYTHKHEAPLVVIEGEVCDFSYLSFYVLAWDIWNSSPFFAS